jgi:hypothetical protein
MGQRARMTLERLPLGGIGETVPIRHDPCVTRAPRKPELPRKRLKKHETGVLIFTPVWEAWEPWPTAEQARARFAEVVREGRQDYMEEHPTNARLVVRGEMVEEAELRA